MVGVFIMQRSEEMYRFYDGYEPFFHALSIVVKRGCKFFCVFERKKSF